MCVVRIFLSINVISALFEIKELFQSGKNTILEAISFLNFWDEAWWFLSYQKGNKYNSLLQARTWVSWELQTMRNYNNWQNGFAIIILNRWDIHRVETYWLIGKEKVPPAAVSKKGYIWDMKAPSLLISLEKVQL